ncbi:TetR family transcriptional regulator [Clostridia bacterium]|nr:TetR family transcriptional regulator [Clostridia bacterium]
MPNQSNKREDVLNAALAIIAEQGFHAAPISQIAEKANIGAGTIYRYFKSKEELINALYLEVRKRMAQEILKGQDTSGSVYEQFVRYMQNLISYLIEHPTEIQFTEQYENSPFVTEATRGEVNKIASPISDLFIRAREAHMLKNLPFQVIMTLLSGASMALLKTCMHGELPTSQIDSAIDAIWDMLTRKDGFKQ